MSLYGLASLRANMAFDCEPTPVPWWERSFYWIRFGLSLWLRVWLGFEFAKNETVDAALRALPRALIGGTGEVQLLGSGPMPA